MTTIVQTATGTGFNGSVTFSAGVTAGNTLIVKIGGFNGGGNGPSFTNVQLGTGTPLGTSQDSFAQGQVPASGNVSVSTWSIPVTAGFAGQTTITAVASVNQALIYAWEVNTSGFALSVDKLSISSATSSGTATDSGSTGAITGTNDFVAAAAIIFGQAMTGPGSPWTSTGLPSGSNFMTVGYQEPASSGGSYDFQATGSGAAPWQSDVVAYMPSGGVTSISVSDFAGQVESYALAATVTLTDQAGQEEAGLPGATVPVSDKAGAVESLAGIAGLSLADFAGAIDAVIVSGSASISVSDAAGATDFISVTASIPVSDSGGSADARSINVTMSWQDFAGVRDSIQTPTFNQLVRSMVFASNVYTSMTSSIAFSCNAGEPYQGNMRQLATDRWNYMYPS